MRNSRSLVVSLAIAGFATGLSGCSNDELMPKEEAIMKVEEKTNGIVTGIELEENAIAADQYDMDLVDKEAEKSLLVNAETGVIMSEKIDVERDSDELFEAKPNSNPVITPEAAQIIAQENADGGDIVSFEHVIDDGISQYEIDVMTDNIKTSIEIDANTGQVLEMEQENIVLDD